MTARAASLPAGRHDRLAEGHGRLAHGRELDRVAAGALDRAADPVDIHSDRFAAFTIASTSRSQMSPFQSSIRAKAPPLGRAVRIPDRSGRRMVHPGQTRGHRGHDLPASSWCAIRASSAAVDRSSPCRPDQDELVVDRRPAARDVGHVGHRPRPSRRCRRAGRARRGRAPPPGSRATAASRRRSRAAAWRSGSGRPVAQGRAVATRRGRPAARRRGPAGRGATGPGGARAPPAAASAPTPAVGARRARGRRSTSPGRTPS